MAIIDYNEIIHLAEEKDIPAAYQPVITLIGLDNFLKLCGYAMGDEIYFPTLEGALKATRNRLVLQEYNGHNARELSKKFNLTRMQINNIVKGSNSA